MPSRRSARQSQHDQRFSGIAAVVFLILTVAVLYIGVQRQDAQVPLPIPTNPNAPTQTGPVLTAYFSDPLRISTTAGPEADLISAINGAQHSVDMAIYNLSFDDLGSALIAAFQRGVAVRLVMDSDSVGDRLPRALTAAGIPIVGDSRQGLMHNKFTIIDEQEVFTGSANYTANSFYSDFNNMVRIRSQRVAKNYLTEFEEMFKEDLFGPDTRALTPHPQVTINGTLVETYFSPDDRVASYVLVALQSAQTSIDFLAYSFTRDDFAQAIRDRAAAGVKVRGVFDESQVASNTGGEYGLFEQDGFDVRLDGISGLMHSKVIIIDREIVITGSYNFSNNAERTNDENILIIHDPAIARLFLENFEAVYDSAQQ